MRFCGHRRSLRATAFVFTLSTGIVQFLLRNPRGNLSKFRTGTVRCQCRCRTVSATSMRKSYGGGAMTASGNLAIAERGPCECTISLRFSFAPISTKNRAFAARSPLANARCPCGDCAMPPTTCLRATVLRFLKICQTPLETKS